MPLPVGNGTGETASSGLTAEPSSIGVSQGGTQQFTAKDETGAPFSAVIRTVIRANGASISSAGVLAVGAGEILSNTNTPSLIVTAISRQDTTKYGTAKVFVSPGDTGQPAITGVLAGPATVSVAQGCHQPFTATVLGANSPSQSVSWTVSRADGIALADGTYIDNTTGTLYVAANEAVTNATGAPRLVVQANSIEDSTKYGIANVTVTTAGGTSIQLAGGVGVLYVGGDEVLADASAPSLIVRATSTQDSAKYSCMAIANSLLHRPRKKRQYMSGRSNVNNDA
jgi:hypothetical protein